MLEKYTKVRLTDEDGLNAETAWAFGHCESKTMRTPDNLYLILDNNTEYFPAGTELILSDDGYNVDMEATRALYMAHRIIEKYHGITRRDYWDATTRTAKRLIDKFNLTPFIGKKIEVSSGEVVFTELKETKHGLFLVGKNQTTGEEKLYNDLEWLARKLGYSKEELDRITI